MRSVTWPQVLAWRMRRQFLDTPAPLSAAEIVARLCGVQAQVASAAELAVAIRQHEPGDELTMVDVEGRRAYLLAEDVDEVAGQQPTTAVRLLPGFDQYVLGPGTGDERVVPAAHRGEVSRAAGWISPVVVAGGRVVGVWSQSHGTDTIDVTLWEDVDEEALQSEIARLAAIRS